MDKNFWHRRWQKNEIGFHMTDPHHFLQQFFPLLQTQPTDSVFVPLCGKSPDLVWLREEGLKVVGIELSRTAIVAFFNENDLPGHWTDEAVLPFCSAEGYKLYCGDFFDLTATEVSGINAYYDRGALVALPPEMRVRYVAHMAALMPPGGRVLLISYSYNQSETKGPPFSVPQQELEILFSESFRVEILSEEDALRSHQGLAARGVTKLMEYAVLLTRK
ncbi:MAG TPA: thiopurine S-methyltransferase [Desulfuromonadales bacterium]|jgi:thiopurine S-methyltransferase|nr:thiopurine S-methyltransferase [Desulfuromonadales bacterium]